MLALHTGRCWGRMRPVNPQRDDHADDEANQNQPWIQEPTWIDPAIEGAEPDRIYELVTAAADQELYAWARAGLSPAKLMTITVRRIRNQHVATASSAETPGLYTEPFSDADGAIGAAEILIQVLTTKQWKPGDEPLWQASGGRVDLLAKEKAAKPGAVKDASWRPACTAELREAQAATQPARADDVSTRNPRLAGFDSQPRRFNIGTVSSFDDTEEQQHAFWASHSAALNDKHARCWPVVKFGPRSDPPWPIPTWEPVSEDEYAFNSAIYSTVVGRLINWGYQAPAANQVRRTKEVIGLLEEALADAGGLEGAFDPVLAYLHRAVTEFGADPIRPQELYLAFLDIGILVKAASDSKQTRPVSNDQTKPHLDEA